MNAKSKKREEWQLIVEQFLQCDQTIEQYCKHQNIKVMTFKHWFYQLRPKPIEIKKEKFIGFKLPQSISNVKVTLPNGIGLEIITKNLTELIKELNRILSIKLHNCNNY